MPSEANPPEKPPEGDSTNSAEVSARRVLQLVAESLNSIRYGQVVLTIHDGVVVQFEKVIKTRLR